MEFEIVETPIRFQLHGLSSDVQNNRYGEVGLKLMDEMWKVVRESQTAPTGINHWIYLPDNQMFVGIELMPNSRCPGPLEPLMFEWQRHPWRRCSWSRKISGPPENPV